MREVLKQEHIHGGTTVMFGAGFASGQLTQ
jgi:hypothetical protein